MSLEQDAAESEWIAFESAFGSLVPSRSGLDRDRVMFEAGRAAARRSAGAGRAVALLSTFLLVVAIGEGAILVRMRGLAPTTVSMRVADQKLGSAPRITIGSREPVVDEMQDEPANEGREWPVNSEATRRDRLMDQVLRYGLDGLPSPTPLARHDEAPSILQAGREWPAELRKELELGGPS